MMSLLVIYSLLIGCDPWGDPSRWDAPVVAVPAPRPDTGSTDFALLAGPLTDGESRVELEDTGQQIARTAAIAGTER